MLKKIGREAQRIGKQVEEVAKSTSDAVANGTVSKEAERIGQQIGAAGEKLGQQVRDASTKAAEQGEEGRIRIVTREQREESNERNKRCQNNLAELKKSLPNDFVTNEANKDEFAQLELVLKNISNLAEKIRGRDQAKHEDYAFKSETTDDPVQDCKKWLAEQSKCEKTFDATRRKIISRSQALQVLASQGLVVILSKDAKTISGSAEAQSAIASNDDERDYDAVPDADEARSSSSPTSFKGP